MFVRNSHCSSAQIYDCVVISGVKIWVVTSVMQCTFCSASSWLNITKTSKKPSDSIKLLCYSGARGLEVSYISTLAYQKLKTRRSRKSLNILIKIRVIFQPRMRTTMSFKMLTLVMIVLHCQFSAKAHFLTEKKHKNL